MVFSYRNNLLNFIANGRLYTWGYGHQGELCHPDIDILNQPLHFNSSLVLSSKIAICHQSLTGIITSKKCNIYEYLSNLHKTYKSFFFQ